MMNWQSCSRWARQSRSGDLIQAYFTLAGGKKASIGAIVISNGFHIYLIFWAAPHHFLV